MPYDPHPMSAREWTKSAWIVSRIRPALYHALGSAMAAGQCTLPLARLWSPHPHNRVAGGLKLMAIMVSVDIVLGPVLTLVIAAPGKLIRVWPAT
jgi:hypothetical protein